MSGVIRVPDLPDLGAVTDDTSVVAEHMGTGRIVATALRDYMVATGGGPYMPQGGGSFTGSITTGAGYDITSGQDVFVARRLAIGAATGYQWGFTVGGSGEKIQTYQPNVYDVVDVSGNRAWTGVSGTLMGLSASGNLVVNNEAQAATLRSTGDIYAGHTVYAQYLNSLSLDTGNITGTTITATGGITSSGDVHAANVYASGQVNVGSGFAMMLDGGGLTRAIYFSASWRLSWDSGAGNLTYIRNGDGAALMSSIGATGEFVINGANAYKPGGGSWTAPSDERIKTVVGDYTRGLADILQLQPKRFTYRGNDTLSEPEEGHSAPYSSSPNYIVAKDGREFAGLIAQELQPVMPEMCREYTGYIDGVVKSDMLTVDRSDLNLALVNAVKELEARVRALEAVRSAPATKAG